MRLQAFIISESRTQSIDEDKWIEITKKNCQKHIKGLKSGSVPGIYRGIGNFSDQFGMVDPTKGRPRVSANTSNHMTLLIDNLPSWKGYPKRSQSIICTTRAKTAQAYGWNGFYQVYPFDRCKIATAPAPDIWYSFKESMENVSEFNDILKLNTVDASSFSNLKKSMVDVYEKGTRSQFSHLIGLEVDPDEEKVDSTVRLVARSVSKMYGREMPVLNQYVVDHLKSIYYRKKGISIMNRFDNQLSPKTNKFKLGPPTSSHKANEVWIGEAPIMIVSAGLETYDKFLTKNGLI